MEINKVVKPFIRRGWPNTFGNIVYMYSIYVCCVCVCECVRETFLFVCINSLLLLQIGINPGLLSAYKGRHYPNPGNHFCMYYWADSVCKGCLYTYTCLLIVCWMSDREVLISFWSDRWTAQPHAWSDASWTVWHWSHQYGGEDYTWE